MSRTPCAIAVDLGGTNLRVGIVCDKGEVIDRVREKSEPRSGNVAVLDRVGQMIRLMERRIKMREGEVCGVALGFPGIVDVEKGIVHQSPHFSDWKDLDLLSWFKKEFSWPVVVDNDANMVARGEAWKGAGQGVKNFVMLTFGTGIGGGIILNGEVHHGDQGFAGEVGHICIDAKGPPCACGSQGCLESFVSSGGLLRLVEISDNAEGRERLLARLGSVAERLTVQKLYEAALDGDIFANIIFKKMGYYLGIGIASLANTLGVNTFVLGGGISGAWDFFIEPAKKELAERTYRETARHIQIRKGVLGDDAGLVGGGATFFSRKNSSDDASHPV